ncbi:MAG: hypothetical protein M1483_01490 [Actinobacteria bacterium]|nr:hypothetical protein [Actinomycetota bacterium]MCL6104305.1 hypothetical protein [Actinomycetota bacterium]
MNARKSNNGSFTQAGNLGESILHVLVPTGLDASVWDELVARVSTALMLHPLARQLTQEITGDIAILVNDILEIASHIDTPVLLLPFSAARKRLKNGDTPVIGAVSSPTLTAAVLKRVVIPVDATDLLAAGAVEMANIFHAIGVDTTLLHVIDEHTRPRIWEGVGHYVEAWRQELSIQHKGIPDRSKLDTVTGMTSVQIKAYLIQGDLVVVLWNRDPHPDRATILRQLLSAGGLDVPLLLYPLGAQFPFQTGGNKI